MSKRIYLLFDGAMGGIGHKSSMGLGCAIFYEDRTLIHEHSEVIRFGEKGFMETSSNLSEYLSLRYGLDYLFFNNYKHSRIICMGDSELVIKQMNREYRINEGVYAVVARETRILSNLFTNISFEWIPREKNTYADKLSRKSFLRG